MVNTLDGQVVQCIPQKVDEFEEDEIVNFAASESGNVNHIAIAFKSGLIRLYRWDSATSGEQEQTTDAELVFTPEPIKLVKSWKSNHTGPIVCMRFDPNESNLLATGGSEGNVIIWDLVGQYITHFLKGCKGIISLIEFQRQPTEDQYLIAVSGTHDNKVHVWNLRNSDLVCSLAGHCSEVTDARFFSQGNHFSERNTDKEESRGLLLLTVSSDKIAITWCLQTLNAVRKIPIYDSMASMFVLPRDLELSFLKKDLIKGRVFAVAGEKGKLTFWDSVSGVCYGEVLLMGFESQVNPHPVTQLFFCETNNQLTVTTFENNIMVFDLMKLKLIGQYAGYNDEILDVKFLGNEETYIAVATNSTAIKVFDLRSTSCLIAKAHEDIVINLQTFPANKNLLCSCSKDKSFKVWFFNAETFKLNCIFEGIGHNETVSAIGTPYLTTKWAASGSEDTTLKIWSIPADEDKKKDKEEKTISLQRRLISQVTVKAHDKLINCISVSPNDKLLATCSNDKSAKLWKFEKETSNMSAVGTLSGHRRAVWSVQFSPVDQVVVTSSADSTIKIWSLADYSCLKTFQGHESSVFKVLFMSRGLQLLSSSSDGNVKIWNIKDAECVKTIDAHEEKIYSMVLSNDEKTLVTGSYDSEIKVWNDVTLEEMEQKRKKEFKQLETKSLLENLLYKRKWKRAVKFSLLLNQPFTTLNIFKEMNFELADEEERNREFAEIFSKLNEYQVCAILNFAVQWNTSQRHCEITQIILNTITRTLGEQFFELPNIKEVVQKLDPYIRKHYQRYDKLCQTVTFFDFLYNNMKITDLEVR